MTGERVGGREAVRAPPFPVAPTWKRSETLVLKTLPAATPLVECLCARTDTDLLDGFLVDSDKHVFPVTSWFSWFSSDCTKQLETPLGVI